MSSDPNQTTPPLSPAPASASMTPAAPVSIATPRSRGGGWLNLVLLLALALAIGGVAFALGRSTAPATNTVTGMGPGTMVGPQGTFAPGVGGQDGAGPAAMLGTGGPTIDGVVASIDDGTLTITLDSGDSMTVALDDTTTYHSAAEASEEDVAVGDDVAVRLSGGGRFGLGPDSSAAPSVTARDVTVVE